ncbi:RND transporter [Noviherbaspirillum cavernae]|uniref:RND transporter n=1 Tax=Noviherbaspirillum cavernae TaxID=2320862 RepID=A0A418WXW3_9BURK|nr:copper-binding protein [Noviherbaspirillum cavernae]RJG05059.1 RND transporter [Noviherbaspirillum cavernae]
MKHLSAIALAALLGLATPLIAAAATDTTGSAETKPTQDSAAMSDGEVKKIDKDAGKVTIKHGELKNLDMPPMTMVFRVKDASVLDQLKAGDKIRFVADKSGGQFTVTRVEVRK